MDLSLKLIGILRCNCNSITYELFLTKLTMSCCLILSYNDKVVLIFITINVIFYRISNIGGHDISCLLHIKYILHDYKTSGKFSRMLPY